MNFFKDPKYRSIRVVLLLIIVAGAGWFVVSNMNQSNSNQGRVINPVPTPASCSSSQYYVDGKCYDANKILTNTKNPYDSAGAQHNIGLDYVLKRLPAKASIQQIRDVVAQYAKFAGFTIDTEALLSDNFFAQIKSGTGFPVNIQKYVDKVKAINPDSIVGIYNQIIMIENQIMADSKLSNSDREILLRGTSVARYSNFFWGEIHKIGGTVAFKTYWWQNSVAEASWFSDLLTTVGADVIGACAGGLLGGPVGAGIGAVAGSAYGGIFVDASEDF